MSSELVSKSTILDDLERLNLTLLHKWCVFRSSLCKYERK